MDRELLLQLLRGVVPGAVIGAALLMLMFWRSAGTSDQQATSRRLVAAIFAMAAAAIASFAMAFPLRTPGGLFDWLGWIPVAIVPVAAILALSPASSIMRIAPAVLGVFGLIVGLLFTPASGWSGGECKTIFLAISSLIGVAAFAHPLWTNRPLLLLAVAIVTAGGMSQVMVVGFHALKLGQVAGIGASMLGGMAIGVLVFCLRRHPLPPLLALVAVPVLLACAAFAQAPVVTDTRLDWLLVLLLASIPTAATAALWIMRCRRVPMQWLVTLIVAGGPAAVAMGLILATRSESPAGY